MFLIRKKYKDETHYKTRISLFTSRDHPMGASRMFVYRQLVTMYNDMNM